MKGFWETIVETNIFLLSSMSYSYNITGEYGSYVSNFSK